MKIVIAPDSFKESLSAMAVADAIEAGFKQVLPDATYIKLPMADGGEGTVQSLVDATGGHILPVEVTAPLGNKVQGFVGLLGDGKRAVIEMAAASGIHLVAPEQRNPLLTSSFGTGELILAALEMGVKHLILGIGGSATNGYNSVPPSLRFFAGGDQSVRGYDYRSLAPRNANNEVVGGRYLLAGSLEYAWRWLPSWRPAAFIDVGNAFMGGLS